MKNHKISYAKRKEIIFEKGKIVAFSLNFSLSFVFRWTGQALKILSKKKKKFQDKRGGGEGGCVLNGWKSDIMPFSTHFFQNGFRRA